MAIGPKEKKSGETTLIRIMVIFPFDRDDFADLTDDQVEVIMIILSTPEYYLEDLSRIDEVLSAYPDIDKDD